MTIKLWDSSAFGWPFFCTFLSRHSGLLVVAFCPLSRSAEISLRCAIFVQADRDRAHCTNMVHNAQRVECCLRA